MDKFHKTYNRFKNVSPKADQNKGLRKKFQTMLEIFKMNYILTRKDIMKKRMP